MAPATLAYWKIRGLCQPIRALLEYTGTEYTDKLYECGDAPDYDKSCWFDNKFSLGLDFPNLPYYIDGDVKLTQSVAILRHIARQHDMCGKTEEERRRVDVMADQSADFRSGFTGLCYRTFDTQKDAYLENLPKTLKLFSDFLGDRKWFAGDSLTFVDFVMFELFDHHLLLSSTCLDTFKNLKDFHQRFLGLDKLKDFHANHPSRKWALNNKMAKFGNTPRA